MCHRPGEAAPFSLLTYEQTRPWAKAIREAVLVSKMRPWFADPHFGKFCNDSSLPKKEIDSITSWVDAGAPQGNPKDLPPVREFADGWAIPKPDAVIELPTAYDIPASGTIEYQHILIPAPSRPIAGSSSPRRVPQTAPTCITSSPSFANRDRTG